MMSDRYALGFGRRVMRISVFLAAFLALAGFMLHRQPQLDALTGITYLEVPETHWGGPTVESKLAIHSVRTEGTRVKLRGQVNYAGQQYPVAIEGQFYASRFGSGDHVPSSGVLWVPRLSFVSRNSVVTVPYRSQSCGWHTT